MNPGRRNTNDAVQKRRVTVSEMYLAGKTQYQIALEVGVTRQQISQDLKRIRQEWRSSTLHNFDEKVGLELAKLDQVEHDAWVAWGDSIGTHVVTTQKNGEHGLETTIRTEKLAGDPRYLHIILDCVEKRCKMLGLFAAVKSSVEVTSYTLQELVNRRRQKLREQMPACGAAKFNSSSQCIPIVGSV